MRRRLLIVSGFIMATVIPAVGLAEGLSQQEAQTLFVQANDAFRKANAAANADEAATLYDKSILLYERIINEGGISNPMLFYNLGNAYMLKGDIGRAILNYRRAERLDKSDPDVLKNLTFARTQRIDTFQVRAEKKIMQTLFFWHYDFSLKTRLLLACVFFAILCLSATAMIWLRRNALLISIAVICAGLFTLLISSIAIETTAHAGNIGGVITADQVVARQGDGTNYEASFKEPLHEGTEFEVLEQRPGWLHIQLPDDSDAWIPENSAEIV